MRLTGFEGSNTVMLSRANKRDSLPKNFQYKEEDKLLYDAVARLLDPKEIQNSSVKNKDLTLPEIERTDAPWFHKEIVNAILEKNKPIIMSSVFWRVLNFSPLGYDYHNFTVHSQALNLAMNAIYHWKAPHSPHPNIKLEINKLLFLHIEAMCLTGLFDDIFIELHNKYLLESNDSCRVNITSGNDLLQASESRSEHELAMFGFGASEDSDSDTSDEKFFSRIGKRAKAFVTSNNRQRSDGQRHNVAVNSTSRINELLPIREDAFLVNSLVAARLGIFGIEENMDGCYLTYNALHTAYRKTALTMHPDKTHDADTTKFVDMQAVYTYILGEIDPNESPAAEQERRITETKRQQRELQKIYECSLQKIEFTNQALAKSDESLEHAEQLMQKVIAMNEYSVGMNCEL